MADWIISHFPKHRVYVEPFGGGGSVLLKKPRAYAEVYNDLDEDIVNLFRVLRDKESSDKLEAALRLTPFARKEFEESAIETNDNIELARRTIIRSFMGFGADSVCNPSKTTGFRSNSNRSGTTPAHDWVSYWPCVKHFTDRLAGVVIENKDAIEVMLNHDSDETLFYVDPPYVAETRTKKRANNYRFEMTDEQHVVLLDKLNMLTGMVVLSGYDNPIYKNLGSTWKKFEFKTFADGANERTECLWLSPTAWLAQGQTSLDLENAL
jgi:DNA adenine methylase